MPLASWKDLCIDATDPQRLGPFWAGVLGLRLETLPDGDVVLRGSQPYETVWVNRVPEPRTVKQRVHLDVRRAADEVDGATVLDARPEDSWVVMADVEGGEFCRFEPAPDRPPGLYEIGVDSVDPVAQATWWAGVLGGVVERRDEHALAWVNRLSGVPFESLDFAAVPEPKTVKNRIHWDITGRHADLLDHGATLLRSRDDEIGWDVMADPEGNEFCLFPPPEPS